MGDYMNARKVLIYIRDDAHGNIAPNSEERIATNVAKLDGVSAKEGMELAVDNGYFDLPKETGGHYTLNGKGKRFLHKKWIFPTGMYKAYTKENPWLVSLFSGAVGGAIIKLILG